MALPLLPIVGPIVARRGVQQGVRSLAPYVYKGLRVAAEAVVTAMQTEVRKHVKAEGVAPWYIPSRTQAPDWGQAHDTERLLDLYGQREAVNLEINPEAMVAPPILMPSSLVAPAPDLPALPDLSVPTPATVAKPGDIAIPVSPPMPAIKDMSGIRAPDYVAPDIEFTLKVNPIMRYSSRGRAVTWNMGISMRHVPDGSTRKRARDRKASNKYSSMGAAALASQMRLYRFLKRGVDWYGHATEAMDFLDVLGQNLLTGDGRAVGSFQNWGDLLDATYQGGLQFDWVGFTIDYAIEQTNDRLIGMTDLSSSSSRLQQGYGRGIGLNFAERERNALHEQLSSSEWFEPLRSAVAERRAWWLSGP